MNRSPATVGEVPAGVVTVTSTEPEVVDEPELLAGDTAVIEVEDVTV